MAKELDAILDHGEAGPAQSCLTDDGSAKFLEKIICPIYDTLAKVSCYAILYSKSYYAQLFKFISYLFVEMKLPLCC